MDLPYRDQFGLHDRADRQAPGFWRGRVATVTAHLLRPRRFAPEVAVWTVIGLLLVLFAVVLITGETTVARGGR